MTASPLTNVTLRALEGEPLADDRIREMVVAAAHGLAERHGIEVVNVDTEPDRISVTLQAPRVTAVGFAAELRRNTTQWYARKFGVETLWGEPPDDSPDVREGDPGDLPGGDGFHDDQGDGESWKNA